MIPPFDEVLGDLMAKASECYTSHEIISALEVWLIRLKEEQAPDDWLLKDTH